MSKFEIGQTVKIVGNSYSADPLKIGKTGIVKTADKNTDGDIYAYKVDTGDESMFWWSEKDLECVPEEGKDVTNNSEIGKFNVGDVVRCIRKSPIGALGKVGELYTVTEYVKDYGLALLNESGDEEDGLDESRFELAIAANPSNWYEELGEIFEKLVDNPKLQLQSRGIFDNDFSDDLGINFTTNRKYRIKPESNVRHFCVYKGTMGGLYTSAFYKTEAEMLETVGGKSTNILQKYTIELT